MSSEITIDPRFEGPPGIANGGIVAGRLAARLGSPRPGPGGIEVTLRAPAPLGRPLACVGTDAGVELRDGDTVLASARPADLELDVPAPPSAARIEAVAGRCRALETHPFPRCFVCGPDRAVAEGLRILPGWLASEARVAAVWVPHPALADSDGFVPDDVVWSALDCTSSFPLLEDPEARHLEPMVLGRLTARLDRRAKPGETLFVTAWTLGLEGRRGRSGVAIHDASGAPVGRGLAIWISMAGTDSAFSRVRA